MQIVICALLDKELHFDRCPCRPAPVMHSDTLNYSSGNVDQDQPRISSLSKVFTNSLQICKEDQTSTPLTIATVPAMSLHFLQPIPGLVVFGYSRNVSTNQDLVAILLDLSKLTVVEELKEVQDRNWLEDRDAVVFTCSGQQKFSS